jgi:hypothetical protein
MRVRRTPPLVLAVVSGAASLALGMATPAFGWADGGGGTGATVTR